MAGGTERIHAGDTRSSSKVGELLSSAVLCLLPSVLLAQVPRPGDDRPEFPDFLPAEQAIRSTLVQHLESAAGARPPPLSILAQAEAQISADTVAEQADAGAAPAEITVQHVVQVGAFADPANAARLLGLLQQMGFAALTESTINEEGVELTRLLAGPYTNRDAALAAKAALEADGWTGFVRAETPPVERANGIAPVTRPPSTAAHPAGASSTTGQAQGTSAWALPGIATTAGVEATPIEGLQLPVPMIEPPANADEFRFVLNDLSIEGATVFSSSELIAPHSSAVGSEVSLADLYRISNAITARYRNDGYVLSQVFVPAQTISDGRVTLRAIEGYIADVIFQGETKGRSGMLEKMARKIRSSRPLKARDLERYLLLMNDLPGALAQGTIRASQTVPGASDLIITFYHDTVDFSTYIDNHNSVYLGPQQVGANLTLNSVLGAYESTSLQYIQATRSAELEYAAVTHSQQLTGGLKLSLRGSTFDSVPGLDESFRAFNLESAADDLSIRLDYPIRRSRASNLYWFSRLTYHDGETNSSFITEQSADTISAFRMGLTYDFVDRWRGINIVEVEVSKGLDAFGASKIDDEDLSRPGGDPEFTKATLYAARLQSIGPGWSVLLAVTGQYAFDNVLGPEEFAFGGQLFGRAYDPSELVGDHGVAGKLEIRYTKHGSSGSGATIYAFYDIGMVDQILGPDESKESESASSAGLGIRFDLGRHISGYVEGAAPLTRIVAAELNDDARVFGGLRIQF